MGRRYPWWAITPVRAWIGYSRPHVRRDPVQVPRPADFDRDGRAYRWRSNDGRSYEGLYAARVDAHRRNIQGGQASLAELQARYDAWVPPAEQEPAAGDGPDGFYPHSS